MKKIYAAIVTFNRKNYLEKLLDSLVTQSYPLEGIFVFDNASSDGTSDFLIDKGYIDEYKLNQLTIKKNVGYEFCYYLNSENLGGSGGFERVTKMAFEMKPDFIWMMDDDVLPEPNCLEKLVKYCNGNIRAVIPSRSDANYKDEAVVKYNLSNPFLYRRASIKTTVNSLEVNKKFFYVEAITFEGPLIAREVIEKIGFPDSSYFIFYDDTDYAHRLLKYTKIACVTAAVLHKQIIPVIGDFSWRDYYGERNLYVYTKRYGENWGVRNIRPFLLFISKYFLCMRTGRKLEAKTTRVAYMDAIHKKMGKTVIPNKLEEYLIK